MLISLAVSLLIAHPAPPTQDALVQKVSYHGYAAPAEKLIADLAAQSGAPLKVGGSLKHEVLLLGATDVPLNEVMKRMARVTQGEWVREEGAWWLKRSQALQRKVDAERFENTARIYEKNLKSRLAKGKGSMTDQEIEAILRAWSALEAQGQKPGQFDAQVYQRVQDFSLSTPTQRGLLQALNQLGARTIASLRPGERRVYATNPTAVQVAMPGAVVQSLSSVVKEFRRWSVAAARLPQATGQMGRTVFGDESTMSFQRTLRGEPYKAYLILESPEEMVGLGMVQATFALVQKDGKAMLRAQTSLQAMDDELMKQLVASSGRTPPTSAKSFKPEMIRPESKEVSKAFQVMEVIQGKPHQMSETVRTIISQPTRYEPLSYGASDVFLALAKAENKHVVGTLPDILAIMVAMLTSADAQIQRQAGMLEGILKEFVQTETDGDWLVVSRSMMADQISPQVDRSSLQEFLRRVNEDGRVSLDNASAFELATGALKPSSYATMAASVILESPPGFGEMTDRDLLRFYGTLSLEQRAQLAKGELVIKYAQMSPTQQAIYHDALFGASLGRYQGMQYEMSDEERQAEIESRNEDDFSPYGQFDVKREPTEILAGGIPYAAEISWSSVNKTVLIPYTKEGGRTFPQEPESVAWSIFSKKRQDLFPWVNDQPEFASFEVAGSRQITVVIRPTPKHSISRTLREQSRSNGKRMTLAELPPELRSVIEEKLKSYEESYKDMKPGDFSPPRGEKPPPTK